MDIMAKASELVKKITSDPELLSKFNKNPTSVVEGIIGKDLPDDQINGVVEAVKSKIKLDNAANLLGGLLGKK